MSTDEEVKNTVKGMAALVINSGRISEVHETNMKSYPFIFFDGVESVEIDYDLSYKPDVKLDEKNNLTVKKPLSSCYVTYKLAIKEGTDNTNMSRRVSTLVASTKTLFWKDLKVNVFINGKETK